MKKIIIWRFKFECPVCCLRQENHFRCFPNRYTVNVWCENCGCSYSVKIISLKNIIFPIKKH